MGNLLTSLRNAAAAMQVFERGMAVVQGNIANATTPGYARQRQGLSALASDLDAGLAGGVRSSGTVSSRNNYAEAGVWRQVSSYGSANEKAMQLAALEPVFDISAAGGIGGALNQFFQSISALTVAPNDGPARQTALHAAGALARSFQQASAGAIAATTNVDAAISSQVKQANSLLGTLQTLNQQFKSDFRAQSDGGLDAQLHSALESLAEVVDYTMLRAPDGSVSIYLGGQSAALVGNNIYPITNGPEAGGMGIFDSRGNSITGMLSGGRLSGLLDVRNAMLPGYLNDINRLAAATADTINTALAGGLDASGLAPTVDLFSYDASLGAAATLTVDALAPGDLALASPSAPGGNGNATVLAGLDKVPVLDGLTMAQFYGSVAGTAGRDLSVARDSSGVQQSLVFQAREMRDELSRVDLDEEALVLMEFQRAYQAAAQMIRTIDEMVETAMSILR